MGKRTGQLTLPGEENFFEETKELVERLGADAIRDLSLIHISEPTRPY